jgi:predicted dehydrogenase
MAVRPRVRVGVVGLEHPHVFGMARLLADAGAEIAFFGPAEDSLAQGFGQLYPAAELAEPAAIFESDVALIVGAGVPCERAAVALEAMSCGKDVFLDKPAFTEHARLEEVRKLQHETGRILSVGFSERFESRATVRAAELAAEGAIGRVLQTIGLGPHRLNAAQRPPWFFERERSGGVLTDLASHQIDQFLLFTGASDARVVAARVANLAHPEHPGLQDFGEVMLEAEGGGASGYVRVDWFTPDGLPTWGDTRLTVLGSEGFMELRKNVDLAGQAGGDHLFLADGRETRRIDCSDVTLAFGEQLLDDVSNRSETAMTQAHCFRVCELALAAQEAAEAGD